MSPYVYFLRPVGAEGPIKIGCSVVPELRLVQYQAWSPLPLEVVATTPGRWAVEWAFHAKFRHLWLHHEWFRTDDELTATIDAINDGSFDFATLPPPKRLPAKNSGRSVPWSDERKRAQSLRLRLHKYISRHGHKTLPPGVFRASFDLNQAANVLIVQGFLESLKARAS